MHRDMRSILEKMLAAMEVAVENEVRRRMIAAFAEFQMRGPQMQVPIPTVDTPVPAAAPAPADNRENPRASRFRGVSIDPQPCPVTGILNKNRRFSYLMPEVRTAENLRRFRRS